MKKSSYPQNDSADKNNLMSCLFQISLTGSCYTTISITIERFLAIRLPFFIQKHNVKARVFIVPIAIYCLVYNSPRFFEYEILYLGCVEFKNGSHSTLAYDQAHNITCKFVYTLDYSEMRKTQLYISVSTKPFKIICQGVKWAKENYNRANRVILQSL